MRTLTGSSIPNIDTTDLANYPYGKFKNKTSETANDGTELSERTLGDVYQGMIEIIRRAGITPSETAEMKDDSDIADAIDFLSPVMILKCGYDSAGAAYDVLTSKAKEGWTAEYSLSLWNDTIKNATMNLTIKKDGVAYSGNLFVSVCVARSIYSDDEPIVVGASHGTIQQSGYFDGTINIASPYSYSATVNDVAKNDIIVVVYKA